MCIQRKAGGDTMNKTRPNRVYCRVTNEELEEIKQCVEASGMTRQDWLLQAIKTFIKGGDTGGDTSQKEVGTPSVNAQPDTKLCPECGAAMQIKNGRRGKFWGCTNFPRCHHTEDWNGD